MSSKQKKNKTRYRRWPAALKEKDLHIKGLTFFTSSKRKQIKIIKEIDYE